MSTPWRSLRVCAVIATLASGHAALAKDTPVTPPTPRPSPSPRPVRATCPLRAGQSLTGTYFCAQGWTALTVYVREVRGTSLRVEFDFNHAPSGAAGRCTLTGTCTPDGHVVLVPGTWIVRPPNYIIVGMDGMVSGDHFTGRMTHPMCGTFSLNRNGG